MTRKLAPLVLTFCWVGGALAEEPLWTEAPLVEPLGPEAPIGIKTFARIAKAAAPGVVRVITKRAGEGAGHDHDHQSQGTGFLIRSDGLTLTNDHVVRNASDLAVRFKDGGEAPARVVGRDPSTDLALLQVEIPRGVGLVPLPLGDSDVIEVGDWVLAIGAPFGLDNTVTAGIVSATGRRSVRPAGPQRFYADFIQTDASINRGSSGGPLLDTGGRVVGVATAINDKGQGIGFVIPVNMVKALLPQLHTGSVERAWLGVRFAPVPPERGGAVPGGALVASVFPGGPADRGGLQKGDVIRTFAGRQVDRHDDLPWVVSTAGVGRSVRVEIERGGKRVEVDVVLGELPESDAAEPAAPKEHRLKAAGIHVADVTDSLARTYGIAAQRGIVVTRVHAGGSGALAGVQEGDVVVGLDGAPVRRAAALASAWQGGRQGPRELTIDRLGQSIRVTVAGR
ncbi:MAG: hypothetical protein AMXMBFR64_25980 [Myxococcales bacterium]